jgi:hypothetical protein
MATAPAKPTAKPAEAAPDTPAPRAGMTFGILPTPSQHENDSYAIAVATNTLPHTYSHAMDGSPIDPQSFNPAPITTPTWPAP